MLRQKITPSVTNQGISLSVAQSLHMQQTGFLLNNNEGAAKVMIFQQAKASAALMANHYHDGVISGEIMSEASAEGRKVKPFLDSNPEQLHHAVDECVQFTNRTAAAKADSGTKMWGESFYEIVASIAETARKGIGLE